MQKDRWRRIREGSCFAVHFEAVYEGTKAPYPDLD